MPYKQQELVYLSFTCEYFINTDWNRHGPRPFDCAQDRPCVGMTTLIRTETRTGTEVEQEIRPSVVARKPQRTSFMNCFTCSMFIVIAVIQNALCHIAPVVLFKGESPVMFL
jgi:hypothetical protein